MPFSDFLMAVQFLVFSYFFKETLTFQHFYACVSKIFNDAIHILQLFLLVLLHAKNAHLLHLHKPIET